MRIAGQLRMSWACPDHIFLILEVRRPLWLHTCTERLLGVKGVMLIKPIGFGRIHLFLLRDACTHMEGSWDIPDMDCEPANQNNWPKENQEKCPIKVIQIATRVDSGTLPLSLPMCLSTHYCTLFPLNKHLLKLLSIFVEIIFCKAEGPRALVLTAGLVARIWCFTTTAWP